MYTLGSKEGWRPCYRLNATNCVVLYVDVMIKIHFSNESIILANWGGNCLIVDVCLLRFHCSRPVNYLHLVSNVVGKLDKKQ